jgi:hypothetical protein
MLCDQGRKIDPSGVIGFSLLPNIQTSYGAHPIFYSVGTGDPFPRGVKQPMCEGDHSSHSDAEVKNVGIPPLPPYAHMACTGTPLQLPFPSRQLAR